MTALVVVLTVVVGLQLVLVVGLLRSHAEILKALHELGAGLELDREKGPVPVTIDGVRTPRAGSATAPDAISGQTLDGESVAVSPCPGKCLAVAPTPVLCTPRVQAAPCRATRSAVGPKLRTPMTGLSGSLLTSTSGAKVRVQPVRRSAHPTSAPTASVSARSSSRPRTALPG